MQLSVVAVVSLPAVLHMALGLESPIKAFASAYTKSEACAAS